MNVVLTDHQGLTAPGAGALGGRWSSVAVSVDAKRRHAVTAPMAFAYEINDPNAIAITGRPPEGSS
jgi:hypothetical protein